MSAVRAADPAELEVVVDILVAAFQDDPLGRWLFPDDERRRTTAHPAYFRAMAETGFADGWVDVATDLSATMIWTAAGADIRHAGPIPGLDRAEQTRLDVVLDLLAEREPSDKHAYAQYLGVVPGNQRTGAGGRVFRYGLDRCDAEVVPAYLEASSADSARLYRRLGFRDHGPAFAPVSGPPVFPMWRAAG
ncbi:GNAT family N-acetyltransferase [Amycolatopsis sp. WQ 127309]|uniref:GNAT family N-acetyltransferase n=1 Tax=Amycolatopsis sp. WQ 127309 TaxID=2932773 RepID=UPI001FF571BF|nr:GNAT family N-acetyltransferase [Amycolatopsis sp. WQ 127309]UOZ06904.1 GNAT family N-acetyltransferase [Amycolatopsis sp. WQ 127309]